MSAETTRSGDRKAAFAKAACELRSLNRELESRIATLRRSTKRPRLSSQAQKSPLDSLQALVTETRPLQSTSALLTVACTDLQPQLRPSPSQQLQIWQYSDRSVSQAQTSPSLTPLGSLPPSQLNPGFSPSPLRFPSPRDDLPTPPMRLVANENSCLSQVHLGKFNLGHLDLRV